MKVLLVQNHTHDARALMRLLEDTDPGQIEFAHVARVSDALKRLRSETFDAVLIDPGPRDARGLENIRRVQESMADLPVVVFGGHDDHGGHSPREGEPNAAERIDGAMLIEALRRAIERKRAERRAEHLAHHDALTGLPNRRLLLDRLSQAILRTRRARRVLAVLFFDVNGFKSVNDTFGHDVGDRLLKDVAARLSQRVRAADTVARLGGDEFTVVLPEISGIAEADRFACKLQNALKAPFVIDGRALNTSVSVGISLFPEHAETAEALLRCADIAMYEAKRERIARGDHRPAALAPVIAAGGVHPVESPYILRLTAHEDDQRGARTASGVRTTTSGESLGEDLDQALRTDVEHVIAALRHRAPGAGPADDSMQLADRLDHALERWDGVRRAAEPGRDSGSPARRVTSRVEMDERPVRIVRAIG